MNEEELKRQIEDLKEDLRDADMYYMNCSSKLLAAEKEVDELKQRLKNIKEGFEGCCYACEPVGILNRELEAKLKAIEEDGTEEHNNAIELRVKLAKSRMDTDQWKNVARQLYSVTLHLKAVANSENNIIVVGSGLYSEAVKAVKEYDRFTND